MLLVLSGLTALVGILLFALGRSPAGLIGLGLALPSLAAFAEAAKRKPDPRLARRPHGAFRATRERAGVAGGSAAAGTRARRELVRARHELLGLQRRRGRR